MSLTFAVLRGLGPTSDQALLHKLPLQEVKWSAPRNRGLLLQPHGCFGIIRGLRSTSCAFAFLGSAFTFVDPDDGTLWLLTLFARFHVKLYFKIVL